MKNPKMLLPLLMVIVLTAPPTLAQDKPAAEDYGRGRKSLPIFRLVSPNVNEKSVEEPAKNVFGIAGKVTRAEGRLSVRSGTKLVEAQMWNPQMTPQLPDQNEARTIAESFLSRHKLLPQAERDQAFTVSFANIGGTYASVFDVPAKQRKDRRLDIQVNYSTKINIAKPGSKSTLLPVIGGGDEFNVTLGDKGMVIGFEGLWRRTAGVEKESPIVPKARVDEEFKDMTKGMKIRSVDSYLAYYSAPPSMEQKFLYPVYVYRAVAEIQDQAVPLRLITFPATEFGPARVRPKVLPRRGEKDLPAPRSIEPEGKEERNPGQIGAAFGTREQNDPARDNARKGVRNPTEIGSSFLPSGKYMFMQPSSSWREAGTSWIGVSGGLGGSQNNAQGFVDELRADGWSINFNWGDANAWESDWRRHNKDWVDAADFVFYTGHANMNGWVLRNPDDGFLDFSEVGNSPEFPGDMWGREDLEWIIIAACGPLQDNVISPGGGDVFARWDGAFDGLHQLLGYGAITFDNEEEGRSVARYAKEGETLINAWFRTAREIQPNDNGASAPDGPLIWVGVMYVGRAGAIDPANDHLWLHGSVAADPTSPNYYVAMWTTT
jgi:Family of unknown function (DUF6345)